MLFLSLLSLIQPVSRAKAELRAKPTEFRNPNWVPVAPSAKTYREP